MILDATRSAGALTFLRASLRPAEQQWPRFEPTLRAIRDVPIGELRRHPDLVERVQTTTPPSTGSRVVVLDDEWISVDPWMSKSSNANGIAELKRLASTAIAFVDG